MHPRAAEALPYLTLATQFLRLAEGACAQLVRRKNVLTVVSGKPITPSQYDRRTSWSDHAVGVAILFNFYHGIELLLKGCLALQVQPPGNHKLSELLSKLEQSRVCPALAATVATFVRNIEGASPLGQFLAANTIAIDSWYESLKYPKSKGGKTFSHTKLKYGSLSTIAFWRTVERGAKQLRKQAVACWQEVQGA